VPAIEGVSSLWFMFKWFGAPLLPTAAQAGEGARCAVCTIALAPAFADRFGTNTIATFGVSETATNNAAPARIALPRPGSYEAAQPG